MSRESFAQGGAMAVTTRPTPPNFREALVVAELFVGVFRRDLLAFYPQCRFEPSSPVPARLDIRSGPDFQLIEGDDHGGPIQVELYRVRYRLVSRGGGRFTPHDRRMIR